MDTVTLDHTTIPSTTVDTGKTPEPAVEAVVEAVVETPVADTPAPDAAVEAEAEKVKVDGVQKRINELTRKAREAERERDYYKSLASPSAQDNSGEPDPANFDDDAAYLRAVAKHEAREAAKAAVLEQSQATSEQRANEARQAAWQERESIAKASISDYDAVIAASADVPVSRHLGDAIMESEQGPQLVYHLAKNPALAAQLNGMSAMRVGIEIGRLEATLAAPAVKSPSRAPAPPSTLQIGNAIVRDPASMSTAEYMAWRAAGN